MAATVGIIRIWWKGTQYDCVEGSTVRLPGLVNNTQVAGYSAQNFRTFQAGQVKATPVLKSGMSLAAFQDTSSGELQCQADTGQTWILPDAFIVNGAEMSDRGGKISVTWNASTFSELTSNA